MKKLENKNLFVDGKRYFSNEKGEIYIMDYKFGTYGYVISILKSKNIPELYPVKSPTHEQKLYALLNYVLKENDNSSHKKGIYNLSDDQIYDAFTNFMLKLESNNVTSSEVFATFGLNPKGEYDQGALNDLVKDIIIDAGKVKSSKDTEYVFRTEGRISYSGLKESEDGNIYFAQPDYRGGYGYEICRVMPNGKASIVKNPTREENKNALLNLIIADNMMNPEKTGIYNKDVEQIEDEFEHIVYNMKKGEVKINDVLNKFGINYRGELMYSLSTKLIAKVINEQAEKKEGVVL